MHISPTISGEGILALLGNPGVIHVRYPDNQQYEATLQTNQELKLSDKTRLLATPSVVIIAGETESMLPSITADSEESAALKSLGYLNKAGLRSVHSYKSTCPANGLPVQSSSYRIPLGGDFQSVHLTSPPKSTQLPPARSWPDVKRSDRR